MRLPFFGRRRTSATDTRGASSPPRGGGNGGARFPWDDTPHLIAGNLAVGNLHGNLLAASRTDQGVNPAVLMAVTGVLAGYAALHAALARSNEAHLSGQSIPPDALVLIETNSGERFLFGNWSNAFLFAGSDPIPPFGYVYGTAGSLGVAQSDLPDIAALASTAARTLGSPDFGVLSPPAQGRIEGPVTALLTAWKLAADVLALNPPHGGEPLPERYWPSVVGVVAAQFLGMMKDTLAPQIATSIFAQAAIFASKVDPETVEPGRWSVTAANGTTHVRRHEG